MKQQKKIFTSAKVIAGVVTSLVLLISFSLFITHKSQKKSTKRSVITLLSHNVEEDSCNPLAYNNQLRIFEESTDMVVRESAHKLLKVNENISASQKLLKVKQIFYKPNIVKVIKSVCNSIGCEEDAEVVAENYLNSYGDTILYTHFFNKFEKFGSVHKLLNQWDVQLPSILFNHSDFVNVMIPYYISNFNNPKEDNNDKIEGFFTNVWIESLEPNLSRLYYDLGLSTTDFIEAIVDYYLIQHHMMLEIYLQQALLDYVNIAKHHKDIHESKGIKLVKKYIEQGANIISLQETDKDIVRKLCDDYGYVMAQEDIKKMDRREGIRAISLYKNSFIEDNKYVLTKLYLDKEKISAYGGEIDDQQFSSLLDQEISINKLENEDHAIIHVSFDASAEKNNTKFFLETLFALVDSIKGKSKKPVHTIICMDGNFSVKNRENKISLDVIRPVIQEAGYKIVACHNDYDMNTIKKEYSSMQLINKFDEKVEEQTDIIIVSGDVEINDSSLSDYSRLSSHRVLHAKLNV